MDGPGEGDQRGGVTGAVMGDMEREQPSDAKRRGLSLIQGNRLQEAMRVFADLCRDMPLDPEAWYLLGRVHGRLGDMDKARECTRRAIELQPDHIDAHINLGKILLFEGRHDEALSQYQAALRINPRYARAHSEIAYLHVSRGDREAAAASYRTAVNLDPGLAEAHYDLGNLMRLQDRSDEALHHYGEAVRLNPRYAAAHNNLGAVLFTRGEVERGVEHMLHALALDPDSAEAHNNLAGAFARQGNHTEAARMAERALRLNPDLIEARITLGETRVRQGLPGAAVEILREVPRRHPDRADIYSSMLMYMQYLDDYSPQALFEAARQWDADFSPAGRPAAPGPPDADPRRRLRLGYVSGDFRNHPVGIFMEPVLGHHDRAQYEVYCYANAATCDDLTRRLQGQVDQWRVIAGQPDAVVAEQIGRDAVDILIDLSGHTAKNRLPVFALKPAPVQATWLGYFATTGLSAMDYIIADKFVIPPAEERYYVERVVRLPEAYMCFSPPRIDVAVSPPPSLSKGHITFGCFQNAAKVTRRVIACWARLLRATPGSQIYLKYGPLGDAGVRQRYLDLFAEHGVTPERVRFSGHSPRRDYLEAYREVDISLDTFPFNGCTTTMESLWMGVPVVTLGADRYAGHMGETILRHLGMAHYVTDSEDAYVAQAAALAGDPPRLATLRSGLRSRLLDSVLCDGPGFTRRLEAAYRRMWETWCRAKNARQ